MLQAEVKRSLLDTPEGQEAIRIQAEHIRETIDQMVLESILNKANDPGDVDLI